MTESGSDIKIAAVIPCYRVAKQVPEVVRRALEYVDQVFCVDDGCPEHSGQCISDQFDDARVHVLRHTQNRGVGAAMCTGYQAALAAGCEIMVKVDGDGQMDPALIPAFVEPLRAQRADYSKGNRFHQLDFLRAMPWVRLFGNSILSLLSKISSGYWNLLDPTNGFTAINAAALRAVPLERLSSGYFFESDLLFRLYVARAVVTDVPMRAHYGDEESNLKVSKVLLPFMYGHSKNFIKRIFYTYFLRDFNIGSLQLVAGCALLAFGIVFGASAWIDSVRSGITATAGTVMLAGMPAIIGVQLLLSFLNFDILNVPQRPLATLAHLQLDKR